MSTFCRFIVQTTELHRSRVDAVYNRALISRCSGIVLISRKLLHRKARAITVSIGKIGVVTDRKSGELLLFEVQAKGRVSEGSKSVELHAAWRIHVFKMIRIKVGFLLPQKKTYKSFGFYRNVSVGSSNLEHTVAK